MVWNRVSLWKATCASFRCHYRHWQVTSSSRPPQLPHPHSLQIRSIYSFFQSCGRKRFSFSLLHRASLSAIRFVTRGPRASINRRHWIMYCVNFIYRCLHLCSRRWSSTSTGRQSTKSTEYSVGDYLWQSRFLTPFCRRMHSLCSFHKEV